MRKLNKLALFEDLGYRPHAGQLDVHRSPAKRRIVAAGSRWGKTVCAAMEGIAWALEPRPDSRGWIVAPTYDLANRVYKLMVLTIMTHIPHRVIDVNKSERTIMLRNMAGGISEVRAKSADNPKSLLGERLDWVILDEAAQLKPTIWEEYVSQRLLERKGKALLITTPKGRGWVYDFFRLGQGVDPDYESWNRPTVQNPIIDPAEIEAERSRLPERTFRQLYLGEFIEGAGAVFRYVREAATGEFAEPDRNRVYYAGLDVARVEDYSVLVIMTREREVVFVDRFHRQDWDVQINRIRAVTERYNNTKLLMDSTGVGDPILGMLRSAGSRVEGFNFTTRSKSDLMTNLGLMLERRQIVLPRAQVWPEGIEELEAYEYAISEAGGIKMSAPYGQHDDCVSALALAAWQVRNAYQPPKFYVCDNWSEVQRVMRGQR